MLHRTLLQSKNIFLIKRSMSSLDFTKADFANGIKTITMSHPKTRNSLSIDMMKNLIDNITSDKDNYQLRAILITAEGPVFSGGHNLKELAESHENQKECFILATKLMNAIIDSPVPIIAKVDGLAAAAGCQLVAQCDIAICSQKSTFSTPGVDLGIFCSTPGVALARCVNKMTALHMLLTGLPLQAHQAMQVGLVTKVCHNEEINNEIKIICDAIKIKSRDVIELGKRFYYKQIHYDVKKAYELGGDKMLENLQMDDCKEGIRSFIEKRKPKWGEGKRQD